MQTFINVFITAKKLLLFCHYFLFSTTTFFVASSIHSFIHYPIFDRFPSLVAHNSSLINDLYNSSCTLWRTTMTAAFLSLHLSLSLSISFANNNNTNNHYHFKIRIVIIIIIKIIISNRYLQKYRIASAALKLQFQRTWIVFRVNGQKR